ncbi:hypothetical protein [Nostoc sphaeroides]|uniref:hypothetical protein n=1 Tax=Nostoc sphaeroides TaxID=446679 RepID=UPI003977DAC2
MVVLHALSDFLDCDFAVNDLSPSYWYEGTCLESGRSYARRRYRLNLPRTSMSEAISLTDLCNNLPKMTVILVKARCMEYF